MGKKKKAVGTDPAPAVDPLYAHLTPPPHASGAAGPGADAPDPYAHLAAPAGAAAEDEGKAEETEP